MKRFQTILHGQKTIKEDTRTVRSLIKSSIISSSMVSITDLLIPLQYLVMGLIEKPMPIQEGQLIKKLKSYLRNMKMNFLKKSMRKELKTERSPLKPLIRKNMPLIKKQEKK